jgi:NAD(P)-dependent dehydrogenase (short-subunit alcohol dehydrogenase family)
MLPQCTSNGRVGRSASTSCRADSGVKQIMSITASGARAAIRSPNTPDACSASRSLVTRWTARPNLLAVSLDITDPNAAQSAVDAAIERFGRIDTLVNNAGTFQAGFFEEISDQAYRGQMETNFFGPLNVTRAVLPVMRKQRSGHVTTFSSTAGLVGVDFCSAYSASKFALEGWVETLQLDVEPFGIATTIVEPGFFRTELLVEGASTVWPDLSIDDYAERTKKTIAQWKSMNGKQGGDPAKLAAALVTIAALEDKPLRWMAGADSVANAKRKAHDLLAQADAHLELSTNLDY